MGDAKKIEVKPITKRDADALVKRVHYSGAVVPNSQVHLGVFLDGRLHGAMQYGPPFVRHSVLPIVAEATWESVIELNRMAFDEALPRNSESRALAISFRMFRRYAPQVKWILSFSDGCQCGDGTIYRAAGFELTQIKENGSIIVFPDGYRCTLKVLSDRTSPKSWVLAEKYGAKLTGASSIQPFLDIGAKPLPGYQFRYVRFLDPEWRPRLVAPVIPFSEIPEHARMYRGMRRPAEGTGDHPAADGADPIPALHS